MHWYKMLSLAFVIQFLSYSLAIAEVNTTISVPFSETRIKPHETLSIKYKNIDHWDAIICGCKPSEACTKYIAHWKFKGQDMQTIGPNYLNWLELYLGLPPESPPSNADQNGYIKIFNYTEKAMPIYCVFSALGSAK